MTTVNSTNVHTGALNTVLMGQGLGNTSAFSTATYPATTTINQILYSSSSNSITGIATANDSVLITSNSGVPSFLANGTTGQVLTATTGSPASWTSLISNPLNSVHIQTFTSNGTYTPTSGMKYCIVEMVGGGGAGGGAPTSGAGNYAVGAQGGGGEYARGVFSSATIGVSQTVTIGAGGTGVLGTTGNTGGTTSLGALMTAIGGSGGPVAGPGVNGGAFGGAGGSGGTGGSFRVPGSYGTNFYFLQPNLITIQSSGGNSFFGVGNQLGSTGGGYGGAGGGTVTQTAAAKTGGNGSSGIIVITEFVSS